MQPLYERLTAEHAEGKYSGTSVSSSAAGGENEFDELVAVREAMFSALDERDNTIAGTALIGLELLSRSQDEFDREAIVSKASEIASNEMASPASRMTALRMSSVTGGDDSTADTARLLAQTGETVLLRSAAIVTLGEVGTDEDREILESFALDENGQIATAAKLALQKMDAQDDPPLEQPEPNVVSDTATAPQTTQKAAPILIN